MEVWQAVFRNLYTGFLLRDFVGKIVPGTLLLFSIGAIYSHPRRLLEYLTKDLPTFTLIVLAGFAWTVTLGTQSLAEGLGIWRYFPITSNSVGGGQATTSLWSSLVTGGDDSSFAADTLQIDDFQSKASEDEKQQYERFVVIKEACGNLFVAGLLSLPAWLFAFLVRYPAHKKETNTRKSLWKYAPSPSATLGILYILLIMIGLHRMHAQHVRRQFQFARDLTEKHRNLPEKKPSSIHLDFEEK
jgi:hypothetical protein